MSTVAGIAGFELRRLLASPFAWVVLAVVQFVHALLFYIFLSRYLQQPELYSGHGLGEVVVAGYFQTSGLIMLLMTPFMTMRLLSEELRSGTIRLLLSSPIPVSGIVLGKFLGLYLFMLLMLLMVGLMPASLAVGTTLDYGQFGAAMLGLASLLAAFTATGLFISSLFRQPAIAAVCTFVLLLLLWTGHLASGGAPGTAGTTAAYISSMLHYNNFTEGLFSSVDFIYFLLMTTASLLFGIWRIDSIRTHA